MKIAEQLTFGGSGLERVAERRGNLSQDDLKSAEYIALWRGKPLFVGDALARMSFDHPLLANMRDPILLGEEDKGLVLACDLSAWEPTEDLHQLGTFLDKTEQVHPKADAGAVFAELRRYLTRLSRRDAELAATAKAVMGWHRSHRFCAKCGEESKPVKSGWQRDCLACGVHHFPRTDPVVIMLITRGNSVLIGRSPGWPERMYSLLAGFIEPGETMEAAVRREVFEETGVRVGSVTYMSSQPWPYPSSLMFGCSGEATSTEITIDPVEIEDAIWVTREEMADIFSGQHPDISPAREGAIAHFLLKNWLADQLN